MAWVAEKVVGREDHAVKKAIECGVNKPSFGNVSRESSFLPFLKLIVRCIFAMKVQIDGKVQICGRLVRLQWSSIGFIRIARSMIRGHLAVVYNLRRA